MLISHQYGGQSEMEQLVNAEQPEKGELLGGETDSHTPYWTTISPSKDFLTSVNGSLLKEKCKGRIKIVCGIIPKSYEYK